MLVCLLLKCGTETVKCPTKGRDKVVVKRTGPQGSNNSRLPLRLASKSFHECIVTPPPHRTIFFVRTMKGLGISSSVSGSQTGGAGRPALRALLGLLRP